MIDINEKINGNISDDQWKHIFSQPFIETDDSKLQTLQFRINHRILYTNTFLMKIKIKESEQCTFCHSARETLIHILWECPHVQTLWTCLINAISDKYNVRIERKIENFIFGLLQDYNLSGLYLITLLIKKFITLCRQKSEMPTWDSCIKYVKYYKNVDLYSLYLQTPHKRKLIEDKWNSIKHIID